MNSRDLYTEHGELVDRMFARGHLTGSERRRLRRIRQRLADIEARVQKQEEAEQRVSVVNTSGVEVQK